MANKIYTAQEMRDAADFFVRNAEMVRWKSLDDYGIVKYYYADDLYVLKLGTAYAFVKAKSPRLAWRKYCKERDEALGIKNCAIRWSQMPFEEGEAK